jgi:hypothetical protein
VSEDPTVTVPPRTLVAVNAPSPSRDRDTERSEESFAIGTTLPERYKDSQWMT